ncbi:hypothetical protein B566_EDAN019434, partial [Ephemera danica]
MALTLQTVLPAQGVQWVRKGFQLFLLKPMAFSVLFALFIMGALLLSLLGMVGGLLALAALPLVSLGYMIAAESALRGGPVVPAQFFTGLRGTAPRRVALLKLCALYAGATLLALLLSDAVDGGSFEEMQRAMAKGPEGKEAAAAALADPRLFWGLALRVGLTSLLSVPFWHAPALGCAMEIFDYDNVLLLPRKCRVESRSQCDTTVQFGPRRFNLPVVPANMKTVVDEPITEWLAANGYFYVMHRFDIDNMAYAKRMRAKNLMVSISLGVKDADYAIANQLASEGVGADYITIDIAHGHAEPVRRMIEHLKTVLPNAFVIAGNVATPEALAKSFEPAAIEARFGPQWEAAGAYAPSLDAARESFCIQLPPPNVTGTLHMGHAFNQTIMDALTRYHRMQGHNTLWVPGTDHAGIATQIVVERQLEQQKTSRHELGRKNFVARVWEWKEHSGSTITQQMRRMGASVDWGREYFTMDDKLSTVVTDTFVQLYEQGLIYRGKRL